MPPAAVDVGSLAGANTTLQVLRFLIMLGAMFAAKPGAGTALGLYVALMLLKLPYSIAAWPCLC
jgi:hypothetical protein